MTRIKVFYSGDFSERTTDYGTTAVKKVSQEVNDWQNENPSFVVLSATPALTSAGVHGILKTLFTLTVVYSSE